MNPPTVLVLGDYRQTLTVVRALADRGMQVVAGCEEGRRPQVRYSRRIDEVWMHPPIDDAFTAPLLEAIERFGPDVLFPVGDREIAWFAAHDRELPPIPIAAPDRAVTSECQDKTALMQRAADVGVGHARFRLVSGLDELHAVVEDFGLPCFVKPHDPLLRLFGAKGVRLEQRGDLTERFGAWPSDHRRLIVQRFAHGPRHNVYFAADRGRLLGSVEVTIIRTDSLDGTGLAVDGEVVDPSESLRRDTASLVEDLKYTGVGCTQFLVAEDGTTSFLELNPRLGANYAVAHAAGLDLASIAVDLALGNDVAVATPRSGIRYAWSLGDLEGLKEAVRQRAITLRGALRWLRATLRSLWHADVHVTWRWNDPLPSLVIAYRMLLAPGVRRLDPRRLLRR